MDELLHVYESKSFAGSKPIRFVKLYVSNEEIILCKISHGKLRHRTIIRMPLHYDTTMSKTEELLSQEELYMILAEATKKYENGDDPEPFKSRTLGIVNEIMNLLAK